MRVGQVRSIGLRPPYSTHSRFAAVLLALLSGGVMLAAGLPGFARPGPAKRVQTAVYERRLLRCWRLEAPICIVLLGWLLTTDPKARGRPSVNDVARCRHGCASARRPRTRHCRLCNKCVDGFDHHCLWLNTCVGAYNYRAWLGFVAALFIWSILGSSIAWTALCRALTLRSRALAVGYRPALLLTGLGETLAAAWLLALLTLHAYFAWKDLTTLEWIISREGERVTSREDSAGSNSSRVLRRRSTSEILAGASSDCDHESALDVPTVASRRQGTLETISGDSSDCDLEEAMDVPRRRSISEMFAGASGDCDLEAVVDVWPCEAQGG